MEIQSWNVYDSEKKKTVSCIWLPIGKQLKAKLSFQQENVGSFQWKRRNVRLSIHDTFRNLGGIAPISLQNYYTFSCPWQVLKKIFMKKCKHLSKGCGSRVMTDFTICVNRPKEMLIWQINMLHRILTVVGK